MQNTVKSASSGRKIFLFMMTSLDGYFEGQDHDLSWHQVDEEFNEFAIAQLKGVETILFGRRTYRLMESFWPSKEGLEGDPMVAKIMNTMPKVVVSNTLKGVTITDTWQNVTLIKENVIEEIKKFKEKPGGNIILLGSNNFSVTLLENNLLDEVRIMVNPIVIGKGTPLFAGIKDGRKFNLTNSRNFKNGNILLTYSV